MNKILSAAIGAASLGLVTTAQAAPQLFLNVYENNAPIASLTQTSSTGLLVFNGVTPSFIVTGNASGILPGGIGSPTILTSQSFSVDSRASAAPNTVVTLRFEFSQTGVDASAAGGLAARFANSFTANYLANSQFVQSVTLTNYVDSSNTAFGKQQLQATQTYMAGGVTGDSGAILSSASLPNALFSETSIVTAVFTNVGARLQTSTQIIAVPEPASLALFGTALLGLGMVRRSRRNKA